MSDVQRQPRSILHSLLTCFFAAALVLHLMFPACAVAEGDRYIVGFEDGWARRLRALTTGTSSYDENQLKQAIIVGLGGQPVAGRSLDLIQAEVAVFERGAVDKDYAWRLVEVGILHFLEPDYKLELANQPNDLLFDALWGMNNTQTPGIDVGALAAWDYTTGSDDMVVGVVDTGIDWEHPDLAANMWTNSGEVPGNGIDDDGNGYIDDVHGWNGYANTGNAKDDHNHGTHCSGTIGGVGNNGIGVTGVNWRVKLMALKFLNAAGSGYTSDAVEVIDYAIKQKQRGVNIRVLSNSWGGGSYSTALVEAIDSANEEDILFVVAAGNAATNLDASPMYPAAYDNPNILSVAAIDEFGNLASFSNWGASRVDIGAPGVDIYSTTRWGEYGYMSGTSMATPHVSGVAALVASRAPSLNAVQLKQVLMGNARPLSSLSGKTVTGGIIRAPEALNSGVNLPPAINPIPAQHISYTESSRTVAVNASDPENDPLNLTVSAVFGGTRLIELDQQYGLYYNGGFNIYGYGEKWISGANSTTFLIFPGGALYQLDYHGTFVEFLGSEVYLHPELLYQAADHPATVNVRMQGSSVVIQPVPGSLGSFSVTVSASDGIYMTRESFNVFVEDVTPEISEIQDRVISHKALPLTIPVSGVDLEHQPITFSAGVLQESAEYLLDQEYAFEWYVSSWDNMFQLGEKHVLDAYLYEYYILPDGRVYLLVSVGPDELIGQVSTAAYADPLRLIEPETTPGVPATVNVTSTSSSSADLQVSTVNSFLGRLHITVSASDGSTSAEEKFTLTVTNSAPIIGTVANQSMTRNTSSLIVPLSISDNDDDALQTTVQGYTPEGFAYELDQLYDFGLQNNSLYYNLRGQGEKYLYTEADARWYVIMPDGSLHIWEGSFDTMTRIGVFPASFYEDPTKLIDARPPVDTVVPASVSLSGGQLTITPVPGWLGVLIIKLEAADGITQTTQYFMVSRLNSAPVLPVIADRQSSKGQQLALTLAGSDPDGDALTYTVHAISYEEMIYNLNQVYQLSAYNGSYYTNLRGLNEKYLYSASTHEWFIILPSGALYFWAGDLEYSPLIAVLPQSFYLDPAAIARAVPGAAAPVALQISGSQLAIQPQAGFSGSFQVEATASDGELSAARTFTVSIINTPPVLARIADTRTFNNRTSKDFLLSASDADGDEITYGAHLASVQQSAWDLDQQYAFRSYGGGSYQNLRGAGEKYIYSDASGAWFYILPDGTLYMLDGTFNSERLIAKLSAEYYDDTSLLTNPAQPAHVEPAQVSVEGNVVHVSFSAGYTGRLVITAYASDGSAASTRIFTLTVDDEETDSDGDGMTDVAEIDTGSDPFDGGSFVPSLASPIYAVWNSFLAMINILELINPDEQPKTVYVTFYSIEGTAAERRAITIPARSQFDLILNDLPAYVRDSYGLVKLEFDGLIDGRMSYYRPDEKGAYEFAFSVPLCNAMYGRTTTAFNTFQPSIAPDERVNVVANWLTLINLSGEEKHFRVVSFDQSGSVLAVREANLPGFSRYDLEGGHELAGPSVVGSHSIEPLDTHAPYIAYITRYGGNRPPGFVPDRYSFAFPLMAKAGTARRQIVPISRKFGEENWLEVINGAGEPVTADVLLVDEQGNEIRRWEEVLDAHAQKHFNVSAELSNGQSAVALVTGSLPTSIIAESMFYFRSSDGRIEAMYGSQAREALNRAVFGSYNLFLGMENWLKVANGTSVEARVQLIVNSSSAAAEEVFTLPGNASLLLPLHDTTRFHAVPDSYGTVELRTEEGKVLFSELVRLRRSGSAVDFAVPTSVR